MKQTAVEYLWKALIENGFAEIEDVEGFYYQAKEMEKQQILEAYDKGRGDGYDEAQGYGAFYEDNIDYYNNAFIK